MAYTLDEFCAESRAALKAAPLSNALPQIADRLARLLSDPACPGETKAYGPGVIHSTAHPKKAWVIRVTGTDLDVLQRYHFGKQDRMLEQA